jgi:hypothetical protein
MAAYVEEAYRARAPAVPQFRSPDLLFAFDSNGYNREAVQPQDFPMFQL